MAVSGIRHMFQATGKTCCVLGKGFHQLVKLHAGLSFFVEGIARARVLLGTFVYSLLRFGIQSPVFESITASKQTVPRTSSLAHLQLVAII
jgi:hypothetical protein